MVQCTSYDPKHTKYLPSYRRGCDRMLIRVIGYAVKRHFQPYFSYIMPVSFIGVGTRSTRRKQLIGPSHSQTLSHNFVLIIPRHVRDSNAQL